MKRYRFLALALVLALIAPVLLAVPASAASVVGAVSPSGVLDLTDIGYTVVDAGLPDRMRLRYNYTLDKSPCYWITQYPDDVGVSYTDGTTDLLLTKDNHYVFPSGNTYVKLPFDPGIMSNISMYLQTGLRMNVNATGKQYRWVEIDFFDSGFNLISTYTSEETLYSLSYNSSVSNVGVTVSGLSIPEGTVYMYPRLGLRRSAAYSTTMYKSGVFFYFQCDVANEFAPVATTPVVESSFSGQTIHINTGETVKLALFAGSINGIGGVVWQYKLPDDAVWTTFKTDTLYHDSVNNLHYGAWEYFDSDGDGPYNFQIRATVTNTVGDYVSSVTTEPATIIVGDGNSDGSDGSDSGTDAEVSESLTQVQQDVQAVMDAVGETNDKIDTLTDQVEEEMGVVQDQLEESNNKLEQVVEGVTSLPQKIGDAIMGLFVPSEEDMAGIKDQWAQLLSDRFGAVYDAVAIVDEIASSFKEQTTQGTITFPSVSIPLSGVDFEFGGWEVDVVPDGLEFFIEVVKKAIDIVCTLLFINGMKSRYEKTLEGRG